MRFQVQKIALKNVFQIIDAKLGEVVAKVNDFGPAVYYANQLENLWNKEGWQPA